MRFQASKDEWVKSTKPAIDAVETSSGDRQIEPRACRFWSSSAHAHRSYVRFCRCAVRSMAKAQQTRRGRHEREYFRTKLPGPSRGGRTEDRRSRRDPQADTETACRPARRTERLRQGPVRRLEGGPQEPEVPGVWGTVDCERRSWRRPVLDPSETSAASPHFQEPLTLVLGMVHEGDFVEFRVDGRRFEPVDG